MRVDCSASLFVADEGSTYDGTGGVLNWFVSSVVSFAEHGRLSIIRLAIVELCKGGAICGERRSDRARAVFLFYCRSSAYKLIATLYEERGHAAVCLYDGVNKIRSDLQLAEIEVIPFYLRCTDRFSWGV